MVGRFIEQQQVRALPDDQGQYQARFFSTREAAGLFADLIALETKAAQIITQLLFQFLRGQARQVLQRRLIGTQELQLMLGEVAELDTFARPISPLTGWSSPASSLISVDFPAPLRPSRPMREPGTRLSLMESRIIRSP